MNTPTATFAQLLQIFLQAQAHCLVGLLADPHKNPEELFIQIEEQNRLHEPKLEIETLRNLLKTLEAPQTEAFFSQDIYETLSATFLNDPQPNSIEDASWNFPLYRKIIESDLPLNTPLTFTLAQSILELLKKSAKDWGTQPKLISENFDTCFKSAWIKAQVRIKQIYGVRRLGSV